MPDGCYASLNKSGAIYVDFEPDPTQGQGTFARFHPPPGQKDMLVLAR